MLKNSLNTSASNKTVGMSGGFSFSSFSTNTQLDRLIDEPTVNEIPVVKESIVSSDSSSLDDNVIVGILSETYIMGEFKWTINVSEMLETDDIFYSPDFCFSSSSWTLKLCTYYKDAFKKKWISIFLKNMQLDTEKCVTFNASMIVKSKELTSKERSHIFKAKDEVFGFKKFVLRQDVSAAAKNYHQLTVGIKLKDFVLVPYDEDKLHKVEIKEIEAMRQNYKDLLLCGVDHDLVIKVKDKEFKAHQNIMQFRCPVFNSMLTHEMSEKNRGVVEIPDCDPCAFEQFLVYVYTGDLEILEKNMLGLYYIADKYDMAYLKKRCCEFIMKSFSVNVISDVIRLALNHSDSSLLEYATKYFASNAKEILPTVEWQTFIKENPTQANELFIKTLNN